MKNILNKNFFITNIIILFSVIIIIFSLKNIKMDASIHSLFPKDEKMERSISLTELSNLADKVIIYIESQNQELLENNINLVKKTIEQSNLKFQNSIPDQNDIEQILEYFEKNSLLLYPYEFLDNPFTEENIKQGLLKKANYIESNPFFTPDETFFLDPLMKGIEILKLANSGSSGKFFPQFGGIVSQDKKKYIQILKAGFKNEDYQKVKQLYLLDQEIKKISKQNNFTAFLYSSHLYYWDSYTSIRKEISFIFIISIILTLLVFYIFFKRFDLLLYAFFPLIIGFAITFLIIAIFKKSYGGIAFAFGSTTAGISIDYTIHYLSKVNIYSDLDSLRKKLFLPLFLSFITTISAFIFLMFSNIKSLKEIALFGIIAISSCFFVNWFLLQQLIPPEKFKCNLYLLEFPEFNLKYFIIWLILLIFIIIGVFFSKFEDNLLALDKKHKELDNKLKLIQDNFSESTDRVFISFYGKNKEEILNNCLKAFFIINKTNNKLNFLCPALFYPSKEIIEQRKKFIQANFNKKIFDSQIENSIFEKDSFNLWLDNINNINNISLSNLPDYLEMELNSMFIEWNNNLYLLINIDNRKKGDEISKILKENNISHLLINTLKDSADGLIFFEKNSLKLVFLSLVIILLILIIAYKNIILSILAILPSVIALATDFAVSFYTNRGFNIMHLASSIVLLGISVDYGIHIIGIYKEKLNNEEKNLTMQSILISGLTTIAGFGVLSFSSNQSIFSLGTSIFFGVLSAMITSFFCIPFLIKKLRIIKNV